MLVRRSSHSHPIRCTGTTEADSGNRSISKKVVDSIAIYRDTVYRVLKGDLMTYAMTPPFLGPRGMRVMMMTSKKHRGKGHHGPGGHRSSRSGFSMGPGPFFPGKPKVGRGDVRVAILHLLAEEPMHGYQIIQEISERTDGQWNPSPGSVYPTLQQLADEGLVQSDESGGKNVFTITEEGLALVASGKKQPPWERMTGGMSDNLIDLREAGFQVGAAVMQIARAGSDDQAARAVEILNDARRKIYKILAEDEEPSDN
jgi:DNA-binding PadR family transcriptional regulator